MRAQKQGLWLRFLNGDWRGSGLSLMFFGSMTAIVLMDIVKRPGGDT
jgi:hypothetical protein